MANSIHRKNKRRGTILVTALIFGSLLILSAGILLRYGFNEKALNERHFLNLEAQNAAESVVEYGFAELKDRWENKTSFKTTELQETPLTLPESSGAFFAGSSIDTSSLEIVGGVVPPGEWRYIDPNDPANELDPQKKKLVFVRDVSIYGKASAVPQEGRQYSDRRDIYCSQIFQVRDSPLFGHAIFYNMDLEFHPGPVMDVVGPVYASGDMYIQAGSGLKFHSTVMSAKKIYHKYKLDMARSSRHLGYVKIKNGNGDWKEMYKGSGDKMDDSSYYDSNLGEDWKAESEDRWQGMVGTEDNEVPQLKPMNIDDYVPDDPGTIGNELRNPAYALIEPQLANSSSDYKGFEVQQEKFSYKAGLILKVHEDSSAPSGYGYNFYTYERTNPAKPNSDRVLEANGKPKTTLLNSAALPAGMVNLIKYEENPDGSIVSGFYDRRQLETMDVVELDIDLLRSTIDDTDPDFDSSAWQGTYFSTSGGAKLDWNGIMYVEMPTASSASGRPDKIQKAKSGLVLRVKNGSEIPSPSSATDPGFTLATNAPMYVMGNYNADGNSSTGSPTSPDNSNEKPAALIADSITVLSNSWESNGYDQKTKNSASSRPASFTEISAAFLTGQSPTIPSSNNFSGGVHNFPRFLEKWSGKEFRYRGSLVALFESEVNWRHMRPDFGSWYSPPKRKWGFSEIFAGGEYPPGTPNVRDFRRKNFQFITASEYNMAVAEL